MFVLASGSLGDYRYWLCTQIWFCLSQNQNTHSLHPQTPHCLISFTTIFHWLKNKKKSRRGNRKGGCVAGVSAHPAWSGRSLDEEERGCLGISSFRAQCGLDPIKVGDVILLEVVFEGELGPRNLVEFKQGRCAIWSPWRLYHQVSLDSPRVRGGGWGSEGGGGKCGGRLGCEWCLHDWWEGMTHYQKGKGELPAGSTGASGKETHLFLDDSLSFLFRNWCLKRFCLWQREVEQSPWTAAHGTCLTCSLAPNLIQCISEALAQTYSFCPSPLRLPSPGRGSQTNLSWCHPIRTLAKFGQYTLMI